MSFLKNKRLYDALKKNPNFANMSDESISKLIDDPVMQSMIESFGSNKIPAPPADLKWTFNHQSGAAVYYIGTVISGEKNTSG